MTEKKTAIITGGTRGIGLGIARELASSGCDLMLCGRRPPGEINPVLEELRALGARAEYLVCDVADTAGHDAFVASVLKMFGRIDVLVNNAGVAPKVRAGMLDATEENFDRLIRINLRGPFFLTRTVARHMTEKKSGCIVNISSVSAVIASPSRPAYCISKAGVAMASALWAAALAPFNIPVWEIRPGITETDMTSVVKEKYDKLIGEGLTLEPRWGTPQDIGKAVAMLVRGDLPYATGQVLTQDGGMTLRRL